MILLLLKAWRVLSIVAGYIKNLAVRYPMQFIIVIVCCYALWQKTRYDAIVSEYETYKSSIAYQYDLQKAQNAILRKQAEKSLQDAQLTYDNNLKAIKNEYLKKQKLDSVTIGDLRNRLRDQVRTDTFTVPEAPVDTASAEEWRNSHAAAIRQYETLVLACQITTNDYNLLRGWADIACEQVGCEKPVDK